MAPLLRLLVVHHSRTGGTARLVEAVVEGARDPGITGVEVEVRAALDARPDDVLACNGIVIATPENFGAVSGLVKDFLERVYHPLLDRRRGLPYLAVVKASTDGTGAIRDIERITTGLGWRAALPAVLVVGDITGADLERCRDAGATLAAGLEAGLW